MRRREAVQVQPPAHSSSLLPGARPRGGHKLSQANLFPKGKFNPFLPRIFIWGTQPVRALLIH